MNGDSFTTTLEQQLLNSLVMAGANLGAKQIGTAYHTEQLGKAGQLLLHALLGATANAMTNDDLLSGAVSGVAGEVFAELLANKLYDTTNGNKLTQEQKTLLKEYGGLAGGLSALVTGKLQGLDNQDISNNIYSGQRLGKNAAEHNTYAITACSMGGPIGCTAGVTIETFLLFISTGILVVDGVKGLYNLIDGIIGNETTVDSETTGNKTTGNETTGNSIAVSGSPMKDPGNEDKNDKNDKNDKENKKKKEIEESKKNNKQDLQKGDEKKSINQMQKEVRTRQAPRDVKRVDKGNISKKEQDHIHLKDERALNKDGTWKHNKGENSSLSRDVEEWLIKKGWTLPKK